MNANRPNNASNALPRAILHIDRFSGRARRPGSDRKEQQDWVRWRMLGAVAGSTDENVYRDEFKFQDQIEELAKLVGLSLSHFSRAFKDTFGDSPHGYVMRRRLERAQGLILTTNIPLLQIAMECGLADQAHLNRLFDKFVGESPGAWRRARAMAQM